MKRKMATLRYLLWAILFFPVIHLLCGIPALLFQATVSAQDDNGYTLMILGFALIAALISAAVYALGDFSVLDMGFPFAGTFSALLSLIFTFIASFVTGCSEEESFSFFIFMIIPVLGMELIGMGVSEAVAAVFADGVSGVAIPCLSALFSATLSGVLNFVYSIILLCVSKRENIGFFLLVDPDIVKRLHSFTAVAGLAAFIFFSWRDYLKHWITFRYYPLERDIIVETALNDKDWHIREAAVELLPYPQEREVLIQIALKDDWCGSRLAALERLPYPQEREVLIQIALKNSQSGARGKAVERLPYPQEREVLVQIALHDGPNYVRSTALERLPYPQEREILEQIAETDTDWYVQKEARDKIRAWEKRNKAARKQ